MTVGQLIAKLSRYPTDAPVVGTWEGVLRAIAVYASRDGVVLIDADSCLYRENWEKTDVLAEYWFEDATEGEPHDA